MRLYETKLINFINNKRLKSMAFEFAKANNIAIDFSRHIDGHNIAGISIRDGKIVYNSFTQWDIMIHELCHIAVVEPELRHLVNGDTYESYKNINKHHVLNKENRRESVTFGLQDLVYKLYTHATEVYGNFFSGRIGYFYDDVPLAWVEQAKTLPYVKYNDLDIKPRFTPIIYDINETPLDSKKLILVYYDESGDYIVNFGHWSNGRYFVGKKHLMHFQIYSWAYAPED